MTTTPTCKVCGRSSKKDACSTCFRKTDEWKARKAQYDREKYEAKRAEKIEAAKRWHELNAEKKAAYDRARRQALAAEIQKAKRDYYKSHRGQIAATQSKNRARRMGCSGSHTADEADRLRLEYAGLCAYCQNPAATLDHVVPLEAGGSDNIDNLVPACWSCNSSKKSTPLIVWLARRNGGEKSITAPIWMDDAQRQSDRVA